MFHTYHACLSPIPIDFLVSLEVSLSNTVFPAGNGFTHFSTTLLVSPYQDHDGICRAAEQAAARYGVEFLYRDFRPGFRQGQAKARELGLYMQKYCGCVFSEEERYPGGEGDAFEDPPHPAGGQREGKFPAAGRLLLPEIKPSGPLAISPSISSSSRALIPAGAVSRWR